MSRRRFIPIEQAEYELEFGTKVTDLPLDDGDRYYWDLNSVNTLGYLYSMNEYNSRVHLDYRNVYSGTSFQSGPSMISSQYPVQQAGGIPYLIYPIEIKSSSWTGYWYDFV